MTLERIAIIGAGNVGCHLARAFMAAGCSVPLMVNRNAARVSGLPGDIIPLVVQDMGALKKTGVDLVVVAVSDSSITGAVGPLRDSGLPVVHTSGAVSMDVLREVSDRYGSFYPLQTMTISEPVDWRGVPLCVFSGSDDFRAELMELAGRISDRPVELPEAKRRWLHLAAVLMNNNINHILALIRDLMEQQDLDSSLLSPLLEETVRKAASCDARTVQTGPARRNDEATRAIHRELLDSMNDRKTAAEINAMYDYFWRSIQLYYGNDIPGES